MGENSGGKDSGGIKVQIIRSKCLSDWTPPLIASILVPFGSFFKKRGIHIQFSGVTPELKSDGLT